MIKNILEVWIDSNILGDLQRIGTLYHEHGHLRFEYLHEWLNHPGCFNIDPDLSLVDILTHLKEGDS
ncbi:MAG: hypothetical protein DRQ43_04075 [Gammaproteobacteria bacterium]|nr:MAG: hypothetical protein DRQ43_04075 [Gammaproteobacteria bacterium]